MDSALGDTSVYSQNYFGLGYTGKNEVPLSPHVANTHTHTLHVHAQSRLLRYACMHCNPATASLRKEVRSRKQPTAAASFFKVDRKSVV